VCFIFSIFKSRENEKLLEYVTEHAYGVSKLFLRNQAKNIEDKKSS
jgi:hypothetical protein